LTQLERLFIVTITFASDTSGSPENWRPGIFPWPFFIAVRIALTGKPEAEVYYLGLFSFKKENHHELTILH
jgi:hypothetical protein